MGIRSSVETQENRGPPHLLLAAHPLRAAGPFSGIGAVRSGTAKKYDKVEST